MTRMSSRTLLTAAAIVALAAGAWFAWATLGSESPDARPSAIALVGATLPDPDGKDQPLAQWKGKVLVVNFWATWCAPCREEMPMFMKVQREIVPKGVQFVGIAVDQPDKVKQYIVELGLNYPALIGGYGAMEL